LPAAVSLLERRKMVSERIDEFQEDW